MKNFEKKFMNLIFKLIEEGARITPAEAKKLKGKLSRAKSVEQKKALLKEVKDTYVPVISVPKATKATKATKTKRTKRVKSLAKRTKKVQKTEQELRARLNMTEADIEVLRAIPGSSLPRLNQLRDMAQALRVEISDLGRKRKEILLRLHAASGGQLRKFDRIVQNINAEKKDPNIRALRGVARRTEKQISTDLDTPSRRGRRKNKAIRQQLLAETGGNEFEPKFSTLVRRLGVGKGDTVNREQFVQMRDMWAHHLMLKHNYNQGRAFAIATRNVCKAFIYAGCSNQRKASSGIRIESFLDANGQEGRLFDRIEHLGETATVTGIYYDPRTRKRMVEHKHDNSGMPHSGKTMSVPQDEVILVGLSRRASENLNNSVMCFPTLEEARVGAIKLASNCQCAHFVTRDSDMGYIVTNNPSLQHISNSLEFVAV